MGENRRTLSRHGDKEASGFAPHLNVGIGTEMGPGLTSMVPLNSDPHAGGNRAPAGNEFSRARPANDMGPGLLPQNGALNPDPHPYGGDPKEPNTYGLSRVPRR